MRYLAILILCTLSVLAAPKQTVAKVSPYSIQRGTVSTIIIEGNRLQEVKQFLCYSPGITMVKYEAVNRVLEHHYFKKKDVKPGQAIALTLKVSEDCAIGKHLFRIRTNETLSEMRTVWVTPFKCVDEDLPGHDNRYKVGSTVDGVKITKAGNGSFENAQTITLNTTVNGHHPAYSVRDYDFYRVEMKKGQRLTVEQWAAGFPFGGGNDGVLTLFGPDKKKILSVDDTWLTGEDPVFSTIVQVDGPHYIKVHQSVERELGARHYSLHVGTGVRPLAVYPLGGQAGQELSLKYFGHAGTENNESIKMTNN